MVRAVVILLLLALSPSEASAKERFALLIGNQAYGSEIGRLTNPHNDIALLEQALKGLGFEVTTVRDAGLAALHQAVNGYARRVRMAGPEAVGFFYYSGHGAAEAGTNYLIPIDVKSAEDGTLWDHSLRLVEVTRKLKAEAGNATHFVVFDACRNNLKIKKAGTKELVSSKGFAPVNQETGMLIAYATAEGELASDLGAGAGPYAKVLAQEIVKPGIEAVAMFRIVQRRVRTTINQEPYLGFNALGDVYLGGPPSDLPNPPQPPITVPAQPCLETQVGSERRCLKPKEAFRDCPECPEMLVIPPGAAAIGPNMHPGLMREILAGKITEKANFSIHIHRAFALARSELTFHEWDACVKAQKCHHIPDDAGFGRGQRPVINVSWDDAKIYVAWLGLRTKIPYRLPSEAEWEFAARAGSTSLYFFGNDTTHICSYANGADESVRDTNVLGGAPKAPCSDGSGPRTVEVRTKEPNAFGLYDVLGNVAEWVEDCWLPTLAAVIKDGQPVKAETSGHCTLRVHRGGSWRSSPIGLRSAFRNYSVRTGRGNDLGFRVARDLY